MRYLNYLMAVVMACVLSACGGGGGSAGTTPGGGSGGGEGGGGGGGPALSPTLKLSLVDGADAPLTSHSINKSGVFYAKALVANGAGAPLANQLVTFSTDYAVATLAGQSTDATALTDTAGVAKVRISPFSLSTVGAATIGASSTVDGTAVVSSLNFSTSASNVSLANMTLSSASIGALQTSAVTVQGFVDGSLASGGLSVTVNFSASCGSFSPATAMSNSSGLASSTYQSTAACSGPVTLTSSAVGATDLSTTVTVLPAAPANILFDSASPSLIYVSSAASGSKTSIVKFKVVDSNGNAMAGQNVSVALSAPASLAGVRFSLSGVATDQPQLVTTDGDGIAAITVASGSFPTPVTVDAVLVSSTSIRASSLSLSVTTGAPTQRSASLSTGDHSLEARTIDGLTTPVTLRVADRLGNPVPDGTVVNFIASEGVMVPATCALAASECSVNYRSQGTPPNTGRATVLAYLDGEESFVDTNGDNIWQNSESYDDVGLAFLDKDANGVYDNSVDQLVPGGGTQGSGACSSLLSRYPQVENTCDDNWSSNIRVRVSTQIAWASSTANITLDGVRTLNGFTIQVADARSDPVLNAMPSGSTVTAAVTTSGSNCAVVSVTPGVVHAGAVGATTHRVNLDGNAMCAAATVVVAVTTPGGGVTDRSF
jgi:hypothetical protein